MGIDLYAGPLCRWYASDFVTPAHALVPPERRMVVNPRTGKAEPHRAENPAKYRDAVLAWMQEIRPRLRQAGPMIVKWEELPRTEYLCVQFRPWFELRYFAAYAQVGELLIPSEVRTGREQDAAFEIARAMGLASPFASLIHCKKWLPLEFAHPIELVTPTREREPIGSVRGLRSEAESLASGFLGVGSVTQDAMAAAADDHGRTPLERAAAHAIWSVLRITDFALERKLPVVVDY